MTYEELVKINEKHKKNFQINDLDKDLYEFRLKYANGVIAASNIGYIGYPKMSKPFNDITDIYNFYSQSGEFYIKNISFLRDYSYVYKRYFLSEVEYEEIIHKLREISQSEKIDNIQFKKQDNFKEILGKLVLQGCDILWKNTLIVKDANIAVIRVKNNLYVYSDCTIVLGNSWSENKKANGNLFSRLLCKKLYIDNLDISRLETLSFGFADCRTVQEIELKNFDTSNVKNMRSLFYRCIELRKVNLEILNTKKVIALDYMFKDCENIEKVDLSTFDISNVQSMSSMFGNCSNLKEVDISTWVIRSTQINIMLLFDNCTSLREVKGLEKLKCLTSNFVGLGFCPCLESKRKEGTL